MGTEQIIGYTIRKGILTGAALQYGLTLGEIFGAHNSNHNANIDIRQPRTACSHAKIRAKPCLRMRSPFRLYFSAKTIKNLLKLCKFSQNFRD